MSNKTEMTSYETKKSKWSLPTGATIDYYTDDKDQQLAMQILAYMHNRDVHVTDIVADMCGIILKLSDGQSTGGLTPYQVEIIRFNAPGQGSLSYRQALYYLSNGARVTRRVPALDEDKSDVFFRRLTSEGKWGVRVSLSEREYNWIMNQQNLMPIFPVVESWTEHGSESMEYGMVCGILSDQTQLWVSRAEYDDIVLHNTQNTALRQRDTLFVGENGYSTVTTYEQAEKLKREHDARQAKKTELVILKDSYGGPGNEVHVTKDEKRRMKNAGELYEPPKPKEEGPYVIASREIALNREPVVSDDLKYEIEALDDFGKLRRYVENQGEIDRLQDTINEMLGTLEEAQKNVERDEAIEDLDQWRRDKETVRQMKEMVEETEAESGPIRESKKQQQNYIAWHLLNSDDLPKRRWVKVMDKGIYLNESQSTTNAIAIQPWKDVAPSKKKETQVGISQNVVRKIGVGVSLTSCSIAFGGGTLLFSFGAGIGLLFLTIVGLTLIGYLGGD